MEIFIISLILFYFTMGALLAYGVLTDNTRPFGTALLFILTPITAPIEIVAHCMVSVVELLNPGNNDDV